MEWIDMISCIKAKVDPLKFLELLTFIAKRVEAGRTESISLSECQMWGFSGQDVVPYLFLLVEAGILRHRIQVYDHEDDAFEDYTGQYPIDGIEDGQVKVWFKPELTGESFSSFFCLPPADNGGQPGRLCDGAVADSNFAPLIVQYLTINNQGTVNMGDNATTNCVNTGNVDHGVVGGKVSQSPVIHNEVVGHGDKYSHRSPVLEAAPLFLLLVGVIALLVFTCLSMLDFKFTVTTISFVRLVFSIMIAPYLGTMTGKVMFSFKSQDDILPVAFKATGMLAVFLGTLIVLNVINIPVAN